MSKQLNCKTAWKIDAGALALLLTSVLLGSCSDDTDQSSTYEQDIDKIAAEMSQRVVATTEQEKRDNLVARYNQPKTVACLSGEFSVADNLPASLRQGLFATPANYPVMARFANATKWDDSEKDIRGMSLRVSNVPGIPLWGQQGYQDFLLNSYPSLFVATPEGFLAFMRARQSGSTMALAKFFLNPFDQHTTSLMTVLKARKKHNSPLDIRYWSTVPSALDNQLPAYANATANTQVVKYSLSSCSAYTTKNKINKSENLLRDAIKEHLTQADACFDFAVQLRSDPKKMPMNDASVIWDEKDSPFIPVARLTFSNQDFDSQEQLTQCENSSFNPWQSLPAHRPLGRMNEVRKAVYATGNYHRQQSRKQSGDQALLSQRSSSIKQEIN